MRKKYDRERGHGRGGHSLCASDKQPTHGRGQKLNTLGLPHKCTCPEACWFGIKLCTVCISVTHLICFLSSHMVLCGGHTQTQFYITKQNEVSDSEKLKDNIHLKPLNAVCVVWSSHVGIQTLCTLISVLYSTSWCHMSHNYVTCVTHLQCHCMWTP